MIVRGVDATGDEILPEQAFDRLPQPGEVIAWVEDWTVTDAPPRHERRECGGKFLRWITCITLRPAKAPANTAA